MRIVSQDGTVDYPYENSVVFLDRRFEYAVSIQVIGCNEIEILAKYSTEEKAIKAIEELRYAYLCYERLKGGAKLSDLPDDVTLKQLEYICGMYCFPQEDEVEV